MKKLLGKKVHVFLKSDNDILSGILFDIDDECVYVQTSVEIFAVIPKQNVKYYTSSQAEIEVDNKEVVEEEKQPASLTVFVDQIFIVEIPIPPTFDLSSFNDTIMRVTLGNPDVQIALAGKIQKSVEYFPGRIHIITDGGEPALVEPNISNQNPPSQSSFEMSGAGNPMGSYLNPSQMVGRLNKVVKKKPEEVKNNG